MKFYTSYLQTYFSGQVGLLLSAAVLQSVLAAAQAPYLLPNTPLRNAPSVPRTGTLPALTFSAAIAPATTGAIKLFGAQRRGLRATTATAAGSTVSLALTGGFFAGEPVSVSVPAAVRGTDGLAAQPQVLQFTTAVTGTGRGTFATGSSIAPNSGSSGQALADIDNDGDLDLLFPLGAGLGSATNQVAVRLNDGKGNFGGSTAVSVGPGGGLWAVTTADVDSDGDLDLLAAGGGSNAVSVRLNDGRGNFGGGSEVPVLVTAYYLTTADLDGDGDLDLVAYTNSAGQTVASIRLNQGNGAFANGSELAVPGGTGALTLGDVDSDGDLDLLTTGFTSGYVYTCLNQGNGTFSSPTPYLIANAPASVALADVDADGDLDLVVGCALGNTVQTRRNNGQGQFAATGSAVSVGNYPNHLRLTDLDSDGDLDLLTGNLYGGNVSVRLNTSGTFGGGSDVALGTNVYGLAIGDLDGDEDVDFVAGLEVARPLLRIGFNQGSPVGAPCAAADTTAAISPAGVVGLGCGQASGTLRVSSGVSSTAVYAWQYAPAGSTAWQAVAAGGSLATYQATQPGRYRVQITQGLCVAVSPATELRAEAPQALLIPNVFTPNGDQVNEAFELRLNSPRTFQLQIFNRWGQPVFSSNRYGDFWTGAGSSPGVYYYRGRYSTDCDGTEHLLKGIVTLVR